MALRRALSVVPFICLALAAPSFAQKLAIDDPPPGPRRVDFSGSGGFLLSSDWSDLVLIGNVSPGTGALEQVVVRDVVVDPGPVYDGTVTYWRGRYGFRAHTGFSKSCLAVGRSCGNLSAVTEAGMVKVKSYSYDVGGAIGFLDYRPGQWVWPYGFFGVGGVTYDLDRTVGPPLTFIERRPPPGTPAVIVDDGDTLLISVEELGVETRLGFTLGFGTDFRIPVGPAGIGVRFELSDNMHESPIDLHVMTVDSFQPDDGEFRFGIVHNLRAAVGIVVQFGR
jgi:opacity protein-like surface antigen